MEKLDFKKSLNTFYKNSASKIEIVDVPEVNFLMINGKGDPNTSVDYKESVEALFSLSYAIKFMIKKSKMQIDYGVMPLEGLWWTNNMADFSIDNKSVWNWTSMIMQPDFITDEIVEHAIAAVKKKKDLPALNKIKFTTYREGTAAQIMHIGPFTEEGPTIQKVHEFISANGKKLTGKHHEIYLSDIRKAAPEKWRTIIRQPFS